MLSNQISNQSGPPNLLSREWIAIALVGGLVLLLAAVSWLPQRGIERAVSAYQAARARQPTIQIAVEGAVKEPGMHAFPPGVTVREVLKVAGLLKEADRKEIAFRKVFLTSQTLVVPYKQRPKTRRAKKKNLEGNTPLSVSFLEHSN